MTEYFTKDGDNYVKVEDALHTQEHVDQIVKERAERIARKDFGDYDELKEKAAKVDTIAKEYEGKLEAAGTEKSELQKQLEAANLNTKKVEIVHEFKLSNDLAEFVTGETAEEMRERAEKLSKNIPVGKVPITKDPKPDEKTSDTKKVAKDIFGGKSDD